MNNPDIDEDEPLSPAQAQIVARVRWLMLISGIATMLGIAVVVTVIGYRVFRAEGRPGSAEATVQLPKGARVVSTSTAGDRIVVTIDIGGAMEIRTFDARTLSPEGRLRFVAEP
jgi:heme/copper-type cytochrome/quinol oxidase subunit 2